MGTHCSNSRSSAADHAPRTPSVTAAASAASASADTAAKLNPACAPASTLSAWPEITGQSSAARKCISAAMSSGAMIWRVASAQFLEDLAAAAGTKWRLPIPVASRMFVTFIDGVILGWLADRNNEQALDALDGFADQLAAFAEPAANTAASAARPSDVSQHETAGSVVLPVEVPLEAGPLGLCRGSSHAGLQEYRPKTEPQAEGSQPSWPVCQQGQGYSRR